MSWWEWLAGRDERRREQERAENEAANAAARSALPSRTLPDALHRGVQVDDVQAEICSLCGALVDPLAVVRHRAWHDALIPATRLGDPDA